MQAVIKNYFDDQTLAHVGTKYFLDNEEVNFEDYRDFVSDLLQIKNEENENDCACSQDDNCEQCNCSECGGCGNTECCDDENRDCEDNELENTQCECPVCEAEREIDELECFCSECQEDFMKDAIGQCLDRVFNGCPDCGIEAVVNLAFKCLEFGKRNAKQEMLEFLEE